MYDDMDMVWRHAHIGEKTVTLKKIPVWLTMGEENLEEPLRSLRDSLMIISS